MGQTTTPPEPPGRAARNIETYRLNEEERHMLERTSAASGLDFSQVVRRGIRRVAMESGITKLPPER